MKYSKAQILYHWLTVVLLAVMALSGIAYTYDWLDKEVIDLHQVLGQLFIALLVARLAARLMNRAPAVTPAHSGFEMVMSRIVHVGFYICLIAYVATGYVAASGLGEPALIAPISQTFARSDLGEQILEAHFMLKWVVLGLLTLHIAAVLKHQFWDRDGTFSNMTLATRKP